jgi:hypothetical protein
MFTIFILLGLRLFYYWILLGIEFGRCNYKKLKYFILASNVYRLFLCNNKNMNLTSISCECPVCYEEIGLNNTCTTTCGHSFCLNCLLQAYGTQNACPLCREVLNLNKKQDVGLNEEDEDDDEDDEDGDVSSSDDEINGGDDDDGDGDDDGDDEESESTITVDINKLATIEKISEELVKHGFTMEDMVSMYLDRPLMKDTRSIVVDGKILFFEIDIQYQIRRAMLDKIIDDLDYSVKLAFEENALMELEDHPA